MFIPLKFDYYKSVLILQKDIFLFPTVKRLPIACGKVFSSQNIDHTILAFLLHFSVSTACALLRKRIFACPALITVPYSVALMKCFEKEKEVAEESGRREKRKGKRKQSFMFFKVRNVNIISFFR